MLILISSLQFEQLYKMPVDYPVISTDVDDLTDCNYHLRGCVGAHGLNLLHIVVAVEVAKFAKCPGVNGSVNGCRDSL
jgi:hypothetical protein